jgi:bifunctional UDP-N-acetylglucosamine pyrophosphorylase/glucosamine-1-phosphate N-acetyltransferase
MAHLSGEKGLIFAHQKERLGTAHATQVGLKALGKASGKVLILNGDVPLITTKTLKSLVRKSHKASLNFLTAVLPDPMGYGRVVREQDGGVTGIIEEKNASLSQKQINEINTGVYCIESGFLVSTLKKIKKDSLKKEYYLTDLVQLAVKQGLGVEAIPIDKPQEILGANTRGELAYLNQIIHDQIIGDHLLKGVGMQDPDSVQVDFGVSLGADTFLGTGVQVLGRSRVGPSCSIEPGCILKNVVLGAGVELKAYSYLEDCSVKAAAVIGPFARIRLGSVIARGAKVGNFVELKKTFLGEGSKVNHLSYLGDTKVGKNANIGAGTITCNYDGKNKYISVIGDGAFIGSDTQLVAPVKVGKGAYVGSGTTVTKDVPPGALALSRVPQRNVKGWAKKK